ncbi:WD40 repeat [Nonomuraea solani]|uniref:WD40 repeat n=1 Tax=Nonomuraea solani TaxID=1144553 RepID=A0A1H6F2S3_9ACTN|nr:AAA family ATPase [Nonomuraea solani]SEH03519.1 WD40 repeat [Nonomuraea solani]
MRDGIRRRVARDARRAGWTLLRLSPAAFTALLCASALAPVAAAIGTTSLAGNAVNVLGSVGANVLTEVVMRAVARLRGDSEGAVPADQLESELAGRLEEILAGGQAQAAALRAEMAGLLREIGAVRAAVEAAVEAGDEELQDRLAEQLTALGLEFGEFAFVIHAVREATSDIQRTLARQDAEHRADRERLRGQALSLRLIDEKVSVIERRTRTARDGGTRAARWTDDCPYRGLWPFEQEHAEVFYGRERLTAELAGKVAEALDGAGMVVVTGASGTGKSSLLRAGLLPALARGALLPGSERWPRVLLTPTASPLDELAAHLAAVSGMEAMAVRKGLAGGPEEAHLAARQALLMAGAPGGGRLVLVVDQFEELFALGDGRWAEPFVTALASMAARPPAGGEPAALVVLGVRGDYWDRCAAHPGLARGLQEGQFLVGPMTESELRRAVCGPAESAGLELEAGLVDTVISDLRPSGAGGAHEAGALPLLSQAMLMTWQSREGNRLTTRAYGMCGGVGQAVQNSGDAAYRALGERERVLARDLLVRLTSVNRQGQVVRRRARLSELCQADGVHRVDAVNAVLGTLAARRLVILHDDSAELAHDVLLRAWPLLRGWLREEEGDRVLYGQLLDDAAQWRSRERDPSFLYRGTQLAAVLSASSRWGVHSGRYPALSELPAVFLAASEGAERRRRRSRQRTRGSLAVLLAITLVAGGFAAERSSSAAYQNQLRLSRQAAARAELLRATDPIRALLLSVAAWRRAPGDLEALSALYGSLAQREAHVLPPRAAGSDEVYALSQDGSVLAVVSGGRLSRWDVAGEHPIQGAEPEVGPGVTAIALSPDGNMAAVGSARSVQLWDLRTGKPAHDAFGPGGAERIDFQAGGGVLVVERSDRGQVWQVSGRPRRMWKSGKDLALLETSGDGRLRVSAQDLGSYLLTDRRGAAPRDLGSLPDGGGAAAFSADGSALAVGADRKVRFWDLVRRRWEEPVLAVEAAEAVTFSDDGRFVATYDGRAVRLWRRDGDQVLVRQVFDLAGRPRLGEGTLTYLRESGEVVRLDIGGLTKPAPLVPGVRLAAIDRQAGTVLLQGASAVLAWPRRRLNVPGSAGQAAFAPDGRTVAVALTGRPKVIIYDVATGLPRHALRIRNAVSAGGLAFNTAGTHLAVTPYDGADHGNVQLFDVGHGRLVRTLDQAGGLQLAFSRDDRLLVVNDPVHNGVLELATGTSHRLLFGRGGEGGRALAVSPDGRTIVAGGPGSDLGLWNTRTLTRTGTLRPPGDEIEQFHAAVYSPDGQLLAAGGASGRVWLWNVSDGRLLGAPIPQHTGDLLAMAFAPDGGTLHSAGTDGVVRVLPVAPARAAAELCRRIRGKLNEDAWKRLIVEADYSDVC